jgi:hypothetical protein
LGASAAGRENISASPTDEIDPFANPAQPIVPLNLAGLFIGREAPPRRLNSPGSSAVVRRFESTGDGRLAPVSEFGRGQQDPGSQIVELHRPAAPQAVQHKNTCTAATQRKQLLDHLLLQCPFARELWTRCLRIFHLQHRVKVLEGAVLDWRISSRKHIPEGVRKGFDSLFFLVGWLIWKERNARTFNGVSKSPAILEGLVLEEANLWCLAGFNRLQSLLMFRD